MMAEKIDMSLDDIIKHNKSSGRGRRGGKFGNRSGGGGGPGALRGRKNLNVRKIGAVSRQMKTGLRKPKTFPSTTGRKLPDKWTHDKFVGEIKSASLMISNLDYGVSDQDIRDLFTEFGSIKKAAVHYDSSGRSLGKAEVIFMKTADAIRATKKYNGVALDGRPMNIQPMVSTTAKTNIALRIGNIDGVKKMGNKPQRGARPTRGQTRPRRGARGGRVGQRNPRGPKKVPTAEELDAELDAYTNNM